MAGKSDFDGFSKKTIKFYRDLAKNNNREWFTENKDNYTENVIHPAQDFILVMGERLKKLSKTVRADPRTNGSGSIFRIYRDVRFSKDKTPYKTALGILFWEGHRKMEGPGFYFHLEPRSMRLFTGMHTFSRNILETYRQSVVHTRHGAALVKAVNKVNSNEAYEVGGNHYKRVPSGFDADHKNADMLKHNGLYATYEDKKLPEEVFSEDILEYCFDRFQDMFPIYKWLQGMMKRA